jgi:hypothetical protein
MYRTIVGISAQTDPKGVTGFWNSKKNVDKDTGMAYHYINSI